MTEIDELARVVADRAATRQQDSPGDGITIVTALLHMQKGDFIRPRIQQSG